MLSKPDFPTTFLGAMTLGGDVNAVESSCRICAARSTLGRLLLHTLRGVGYVLRSLDES